MGLADSQHIGRIAIHPTNPEVVYVAAVGRLWGPNRERGLYKTTDGGKTWHNTLFLDEDTGITGLATVTDKLVQQDFADLNRRLTQAGAPAIRLAPPGRR
jgi:hypothetical protein